MKNYLIRNEDTLDDIFERVLNHYFKDWLYGDCENCFK
jgi:hypothetical protein